jgi:hypothetical protein
VLEPRVALPLSVSIFAMTDRVGTAYACRIDAGLIPQRDGADSFRCRRKTPSISKAYIVSAVPVSMTGHAPPGPIKGGLVNRLVK